VCGYGAGALVMSPVAAYGIQIAGLPGTFVTLGTIDLAIITVAARFYVNPSPRSASEHTPGSESLPSPVATTARIERAHEYRGGAEAVMTPRFWTLLFVNVSAGIMVLSQVSPMAQSP
jgi:OFA family oxalate/formate antiporter-like MFS transporter